MINNVFNTENMKVTKRLDFKDKQKWRENKKKLIC